METFWTFANVWLNKPLEVLKKIWAVSNIFSSIYRSSPRLCFIFSLCLKSMGYSQQKQQQQQQQQRIKDATPSSTLWYEISCSIRTCATSTPINMKTSPTTGETCCLRILSLLFSKNQHSNFYSLCFSSVPPLHFPPLNFLTIPKFIFPSN